jgi:monoamine oxidase
MERTEVAVIGAGVAGLAAARELRRMRYRVVVLEARDRIGGRILTHRDPAVPLPIELGAEFVHGEAPATMGLLREAGLLACEVTGQHWCAHRGRVRSAEFWRAIDRVLKRIDPRQADRSFADFLATRPGGRALARDRPLAAEFVQGFYAADLERIGVHSIAPQGNDSPSEAASRIARVVQGHDRLPEWLARELSDLIRLRTAVTEVSWERGATELELRIEPGTMSRIAARAAVVTVPLGVLQAPPPDGLALRPEPPGVRRALRQLAMGSARRVAFWFRDFPWVPAPKVGTKLERMSFLHTRDGPFNVWWTAHPMRCPLAVAWSGGPPAARLAGLGDAEVVEVALRAIAQSLGVSTRRLAPRVQAAWTHDWDHDPFARGAYSYAGVNGAEAPKALARAIAGTLFLAGEATDHLQSGTVEGAIATGLRAARQVDRALGRR